MNSKEQKAKSLTSQILLMIKESFQKHNRQIDKHNAEKSYPGGQMKKEAEHFYGAISDLNRQLKPLEKNLAKSQKLRRQRKEHYLRKIRKMTDTIDQICKKNHSVKIKINDGLLKMAAQTGRAIQQANSALERFQKESAMLCGKSYDVKPRVQIAMIELLELGFFWQSLRKLQSVTSDSVKQIYLPVAYNEKDFVHIQSQIKNIWPQPEVRVIQKEVERFVPQIPVKNQDDSHLRQAVEMLFGFTRPQNVQKAIQIYKIEDKKSSCHPKALLALGELYEQGKHLQKDIIKAVSYYKRSAEMNDPEGLYKIGTFLQKGSINNKQFEGLYPNRQAEIRGGIQYYEKAAKLGHLDAITDLGFIYEKGIQKQNGGYYIQPHPDIALKYYLKAKKSDFPRSYNNLGNLYITCSQLESDVEGGNTIKGIKYLEKAVELKYPRAYINLGKCYENGLGVGRSIDKARVYYLEGAQLNDMQCKLQYVKSCLGHKISEEKTMIKMMQLTRQVLAEDSRNPAALYFMGLFLQQGIGVDKNKESSCYYIQSSARLDYPPAITKLGDYYYSGYYVPKNVDYAKQLYEKAASKGESKALINLGVLAEKGIGYPQNNPRRAQQLYEEAHALGNPDALIFLSETNKQLNPKQAMTEAATMGSLAALKMLKTTNYSVPKRNKDSNDYTQTLQSLQSRYMKSGFR